MEFYLKNKKGMLNATIKYLGTGESAHKDNEVLVLKGSLMKKNVHRTKKWNDCSWIDRKRRELQNEGIVSEYNEDYYVFIANKEIRSPNLAACVCLGYITTSAWEGFKNNQGQTLKYIVKGV